MKPTLGYRVSNLLTIVLLLSANLSSSWGGGRLQLNSGLDPAEPAPSGGDGDSWAPILSPDGRFVIFASSADNLVVTSNNTPMPSRYPASLNVFLRDRTNQITTLVSADLSGMAGGDGNSMPVDLAADGRYVLFESSAGNLVPGDTNTLEDVFVRDLSGNMTILVSVSTNGGVGNDASWSAVITPDGRFVAFVSAANNLVPGDTNMIADVFVRDLQTGTTKLASKGAQRRSGLSGLANSSESPQITPNGRYVAFFSTATGLSPNVPANGDLYARDLVNDITVWISAGARAATLAALKTTNVVSYNLALSADGQFAAYEASPVSGTITAGLILRYHLGTGTTDVVHTNAAVVVAAYEDIKSLDTTPDGRFIAFTANTNGNTGATTCVCVWDGQSGAMALASGNTNHQVAAGTFCDWPSIDPSGRFVTFLSSAVDLVTNSLPGEFHLFLRDLEMGTTSLLDVGTNGAGSLVSAISAPALADNGTLVAFEGADGGAVPNDRNRCYDVFVRDCVAGRTELVSAHHPALPSRTPNGPSLLAANAVSSDGRWLAFANESDNLVANDTNQCRDIFVRDLASGTLTPVSVNTNGVCGNGVSSEPAISSDGRYVVFTSNADDLVPGDTNRASDVFLRDVENGTTSLVSLNRLGTGPGNKASSMPMVGTGGRFVVFRSQATTLVTTSVSGSENLFVYDSIMRTNRALTTTGVVLAAMTADGRFVIYSTFNSPTSLAVWDTQSGATVYSKSLSGFAAVFGLAVSPDGRRLAYSTSGGLYLVELPDGVSVGVDSIGSPTCKNLSFDGTGRCIVYTRTTVANPIPQVYLYALDTGAKTLVSTGMGGTEPANARSDSPVLSADGRFVAYRSDASDIVADDTNELPDIFLYDRRTGMNTLLSSNQLDGGSANNRSLVPIFSGDGSTLLFASWASDLISGDFNQQSDIFGFSFLSAIILPSENPNAGAKLSWPWVPGNNYRVEYKDSLSDSVWQPLPGTITKLGTKAWLQDSSPGSQRVYRVVSF